MQRKTSIFKRVLAFALTTCMVGSVIAPTVSYATYSGEFTPETEVIAGSPTPVEIPDEASSTESPNNEDSTTPQAEDVPPTENPVPEITEAPTEAPVETPEATANPTETPQETESPNEQPDASAEPEESATPEPSATPEASTTPAPTETPAPSMMPEPTPTDGESEEPTEDETKPEPLVVLDPENAISIAEVGSEVTLAVGVNRDDVLVDYQWQRFQRPLPKKQVTQTEPLYDYSEEEPTWYRFVLAGTTETEMLAQNPEYTWPGVELFHAAKAALDDIGADTSHLTFAWKTPNYALDGYAISANIVDDVPEIYAEKDDKRFVARQNENGEYVFASTAETIPEEPETTWQDIEGATEPNYTFTVTEADHYANFRLKVTIRDEAYLKDMLAILESQDVVLTEEQKAEDQILYSVVMQVQSAEQQAEEDMVDAKPVLMDEVFTTFAVSGTPTLSSDGQWIENLNGNYEYITEDTYNRVKKWYDKTGGAKARAQFDACWTWLRPGGFSNYWQANTFDENGFPDGGKRLYNGFDLVDGHKLEVASEWYGKTVYFRLHGSDGTGTAIKIPAYTELYGPGDKYNDAASGSRYKKAVSFLNVWVPDVGAIYKDYLKVASEQDGDGKGGFVHDTHITTYDVNAEKFNADPARYMVDAEGNYRMDSVGWGVCVYDEPDISGKAYWILKDYMSNGYGFLVGHDTLYAYAGAYYDAYGTDLDESTIDPNDGTTWYYDVNSWQPGTTAHTSDGQVSTTRGGHFYMNQLMGSNKGSVYSGTVAPSDAPSQILSTGGSHGPIGKEGMYKGNRLRIAMNRFDTATAAANPRYRTPTNYPYAYAEGDIVDATYTHTNGQAAFGPVWVEYADPSWLLIDENYGMEHWLPGTKPPADKWRPSVYEDPLTWSIDNKVGTNNFYLTGSGNFLMNQIGHIPKQDTAIHETRLFVNSVMYVSQRKQCEICAANQHGQETSHFVRRVSAANWDEVITALQKGGNYWYPIDGCYQLTENVVLPEGWSPIKGFKGHWNSDVYEVKLASNREPLLENRSQDGPNGWNLGSDKNIGAENVFDANMKRTTGVARVVGDLRDLFNTPKTNYHGYTVKIFGKDNPKYFTGAEANKVFSCTVNADSKYVISNLPCVYDSSSKTGILRARVYDKTGAEVTEYGVVRVDVKKEFWDNDMTTPLYLGTFKPEPVPDVSIYESTNAKFYGATVSSDRPTHVGWQYRETMNDEWKDVPTSMGTIEAPAITQLETGDYRTLSILRLSDVSPTLDGYEFRTAFTSDAHGSWSTYEYYLKDGVASLANNGGSHKVIATPEFRGKLNVGKWPARTSQSPDKTVGEGNSATFTSQAFVLDADGVIDAKWQYSTKEFNHLTGKYDLVWHDVAGSTGFGHAKTDKKITLANDTTSESTGWNVIKSVLPLVASETDINTFSQNAKFWQVDTTLSLDLIDISQSDTHFRVVYDAESKHGTKYTVNSNAADEYNWKWVGDAAEDIRGLGLYNEQPTAKNSNLLLVIPPDLKIEMQEATKFPDSGVNVDVNDKIGQMLLLPVVGAQYADGKAVYRAMVYYLPEQKTPEISWDYRSFKDARAKPWNQEAANALGYNTKVDMYTVDKGITLLNGVEYKALECVMTIDKPPLTMYNTETSTKYFFRCLASTSYTTIQGQKDITKVDSRSGYQWAGLTLDYAISLENNGVLGYKGINGLDKYGGGYYKEVDGSLTELVETINSIPADYVAWYYPNLEIKIPSGHHVNTVIVWFDENYPHSSGDEIWYNDRVMRESGIECSERTDQKVVFVAKNKDTVDVETWNDFVGNHVAFATNDNIEYTSWSKNGVKGGARIKWYADENRLTGVHINPGENKAYELRTTRSEISWEEAKRDAQRWNSDLGLNGHLVQIDSASENDTVRKLLNGAPAWTGGIWDSNHSKYVWTDSGNNFSYTNWASGQPAAGKDNIYVTIRPDGKWESIAGTTNVTKNYTLSNQGHGFSQGLDGQILGPTCYIGNYVKIPVSLKNGHKYYVLTQWGDYLDANAGGHIEIPAFGINVHNNWNSNYNEWLSGIDDIYTFEKENDIWNVYYYCDELGTDYSGHYCTLYGLNVIDLTDTFGAGNEPSLREIRQMVYGDSRSVKYVGNKQVSYHYEHTANIHNYVVEYDLDSLGMAVTNHSASDYDYIGTRGPVPSPDPDPAKREVSVQIAGNKKIYDKLEISPESFTVIGAEGATEDLFEIKYSARSGLNPAYPDTIVNGKDWAHTGAINAGVYHATVSLTDEAIRNGWTLDRESSNLECDLIIVPRSIDVESLHNNKQYDGTSEGIIDNIVISPAADADSGVVSGDIVELTTTKLKGHYVDDKHNYVIHNSDTNNGGKEYSMARKGELDISHTNGSDPHCNYVLRNERYTGAIVPRRVVVHSKYIEPEYPVTKPANRGRNIKEYDGNNKAVIKDTTIGGEPNIFISHESGIGTGIIPGDNIALDQKEYAGHYSAASADEKLSSLGKPFEPRLLNLSEKVITLDTNPQLTGNDYGDYTIVKYDFSGAIYRAEMEVRVKGYRYMYGSPFEGDRLPNKPAAVADIGHPRPYDKRYESGKPSTHGSWVSVIGLVPGDVLELDHNFTLESYNKGGSIRTFDDATPVGRYKVEMNGLSEQNYPVLSNYIVSQGSGFVEVYPREIIITPADIDRSVEQVNDIPETYAKFRVMNDDGSTFSEIGDDKTMDYTEIMLTAKDSVADVILRNGQTLAKLPADAAVMNVVNDETFFMNRSAIPFFTTWYPGAPVVYADINADPSLHECAWCENYYGTQLGTDHWMLNGYKLQVNQDPNKGETLSVKTVKNLNGEDVQNYVLRYEDAQVRVHPKQRFKLEATVPMYVCMYGYAATGEVITPTEYGIRNYSNGPIQIENINVSRDGWNIVEKTSKDMKAGEMSMQLQGTHLRPGDNAPVPSEQWVVARDDTPNGIGVFMPIKVRAEIAGSNQNARQESYITHVTYTVGEYGLTLPDVPGVNIPDMIDGKPVTKIPEQ